MEGVLTVIDQLYAQIISLSVRLVRAYTEAYKKQRVTSSEDDQDLSEVHEGDSVRAETNTFRKVQEILHEGTMTNAESIIHTHNTIMYAGTVSVPLFKNPTIEFDTQIGTIPYGDLVMMREPQGRFYRALWNGIEGWVLKDDLVDRAVRVHPQFQIGEENSVDHPNTVHVRAIIQDTFGLSRSEFPLQAGEYVLYRLWKKGIRIAWPEIRPRVPGLWHSILKGVPGVHIGITPKAGAIMEYMLDGDVGHLAFVEAVFPNETIALSEANFPDSGTYNERELPREDWKELRPVFISVHTS